MILLCYDGSPDARAALDRAGELFHGQPATILTVWEPFIDVLARTPAGFGLAPGMVDNETIDEATRDGARDTAEEGAELARAAGLNAQPRICALVSTVAAAILEQADEVDATAIVIGTRGLTGVKSLLIGSVSHAVVQHSTRTVVIVPSPDLAAARRHAHDRAVTH
jgi:nucleotide-binding universal stress UspA family protein